MYSVMNNQSSPVYWCVIQLLLQEDSYSNGIIVMCTVAYLLLFA